MAISFVQSGSVTGSNGLSLAFGSNNIGGNCLIVAVMANNTSATFTVSDTEGNAYQHLAAIFDSSNAIQMQIFYVTSCQAGANTVSFNPGTATVSAVAIHEFSGVLSFDVSASATGSGFSVDSGPATTTAAMELLFGYFAGQGGNLAGIAEGPGFTRGEASIVSFSLAFLSEYQMVNGIGAYDATGSVSVSFKAPSYTWGAEIAAFKGIPGSGNGGLCLMGIGA